uniref:Uncharacterized protein n=1 Tax=Arundo donax TaxID=35708 RepID=A0A0A8Z180_ARUDO
MFHFEVLELGSTHRIAMTEDQTKSTYSFFSMYVVDTSIITLSECEICET